MKMDCRKDHFGKNGYQDIREMEAVKEKKLQMQ